VKPGNSLAVVEPVKLAPVTHVRSRSTRGKKNSHIATLPVHAASSHAGAKQALSKSDSSPTTTKKSSTTAKQKLAFKTK
jgi:hypothetical protein